MNVFLIAVLSALVPIAAVLVLLYRALSSRHNSDVAVDESLVLSPGKYQPMERLLREDDFRFLASQPGYTPQLGRRLRAERRRTPLWSTG